MTRLGREILCLALAGCAGHAHRVATGRVDVPLAVVVAPVLDGPAVLYATIANGTDRPDTLRSLSTRAADATTLHETVRGEAGMVMRPLASLPVPAHQEVRLRPGGYHAMLAGLRSTLTPGDSIPVMFRFARQGETAAFARIVRYSDLERVLQARH